MGFRVSLYCVPKETVEKYKDLTEEGYKEKCDILFEDLEKEIMLYDVLTDVIVYDDYHHKFSSRLFNNKLEIEEDMFFGTISKEQFLNIIEEVRTAHIIKWFDGRRIDGPDKLGDSWKDNAVYAPIYKNDVFEKWTYETAMQANQGEWNIKADKWKTKWHDKNNDSDFYANINIDLNKKWQISDCYSYEYLIFDLIHILKIFDWENNIILAIGG